MAQNGSHFSISRMFATGIRFLYKFGRGHDRIPEEEWSDQKRLFESVNASAKWTQRGNSKIRLVSYTCKNFIYIQFDFQRESFHKFFTIN